jgi:hypothetical protein
LGRQAKHRADLAVREAMRLELPKRLRVPRASAQVAARSVNLFQRAASASACARIGSRVQPSASYLHCRESL